MDCRVVLSKEDFLACIKLGESHYNEVEKAFTGAAYAPKLDTLMQLFDMDMVSCVGTYNKEGDVVGYVTSVIVPNMFSDVVQGQEFGMYLDPLYRGQGWFKEMLSVMEEDLYYKGADVMLVTFKKGLAHKLPKGFVEAETSFIKKVEV